MVFASSRRVVKRTERRVETFQDWEGLKMLRTGGEGSRFGGYFCWGFSTVLHVMPNFFKVYAKKLLEVLMTLFDF